MNELIKRVCADILTLMNSSLAEPFIAAVLTRLAVFGYFPNEKDAWAICFAVQKVEITSRILAMSLQFLMGCFT